MTIRSLGCYLDVKLILVLSLYVQRTCIGFTPNEKPGILEKERKVIRLTICLGCIEINYVGDGSWCVQVVHSDRRWKSL